MSGSDDRTTGEPPRPKVWGRRPYADKQARELLNDISRTIARCQPDIVDDPADPSLSEVLKTAQAGADGVGDVKMKTLVALLGDGLTFQEAVVWYWFRWSHLDVSEIHYAMNGGSVGGDPATRRTSVRNIIRTLKDAASKLPDEDPDSIPDMVEQRKRHDREDSDT